jgi:nucleotide-binding universal stress UspA family protein
MSEKESRPVVVGVDGSAAAQDALRWAVEDARRRGCRVDAVSAWRPDTGIVIGPVPAEIGVRMTPESMRAAQRAVLDQAVDGLEGAEGVEIRRVLVEGDPRTALTEASRNAELLVVGSRGAGPLAEAILGSVSSYCVHHALCPVVVIREPKAERKHVVAEAAAPVTPGPLL